MSASHEQGFALPFTIFVIAIVTMLLTGILGQVEVDRRIADVEGTRRRTFRLLGRSE